MTEPRASSPAVAFRIGLLFGFEVTADDNPVRLSTASQRLVAFLATRERAQQRTFVAGSLWPDTTERQANANLRSAVWRVRQACHPLLRITPSELAVAAEVEIDVRELVHLAHRLIEDRDDTTVPEDSSCLAGDLLPDWYDDWLLLERERIRQLRLHALESLCGRLAGAGRYGEAIEAGLAAVAAEPLRETAHRRLIETYLAEGNRIDALRQYRLLAELLNRELGVQPSQELSDLLWP